MKYVLRVNTKNKLMENKWEMMLYEQIIDFQKRTFISIGLLISVEKKIYNYVSAYVEYGICIKTFISF